MFSSRQLSIQHCCVSFAFPWTLQPCILRGCAGEELLCVLPLIQTQRNTVIWPLSLKSTVFHYFKLNTFYLLSLSAAAAVFNPDENVFKKKSKHTFIWVQPCQMLSTSCEALSTANPLEVCRL